jgi:diacylglycerol kinase (ATP)
MPPESLTPTPSHSGDPSTVNSSVAVNGQGMQINRQLSWRTASSLLSSFRYAWMGLSYAFQTQRNFRIHLSIGALAIGLSVLLHLHPSEVAVISLMIAVVLAMELLNTAIESVVDLTVKQTYHELAKIAKDCAAAAVMISAISALLVASLLLLPPLLKWLGSII